MKSLILFLLFSSLMVQFTFSQTVVTVGGEISGEYHWGPPGSGATIEADTFVVTQTITIKRGSGNCSSLVIEPGTYIKFQQGTGFDLDEKCIDRDDLIAIGSKDKKIIFSTFILGD